ncbi:MAG: GNAT family N-acetyltransferase [bacterium]
MTFFQIRTSRLHLRPLMTTDLDEMHRLWTDPGVRKFLWDDEIISRELAGAVIERSGLLFQQHGFGIWAVLPQKEETIIGFGGFWYFHEPPELQILFGLAPTLWNQGYATEIACALIRYGIETCEMERIIGSADAPNLASLRVMEKAGMHYDKRVEIAGRDTVYYAIHKLLSE